MDALLLTDEEIQNIKNLKYTAEMREAELYMVIFRGVAQAQLAHCEPLIRKDEREKLFAWGNEDCPHTLVGHMTKRHCLLCWRVMLGEE